MTTWEVNTKENLLREVEVIATTAAAGYSLMKGWIMNLVANYQEQGFAVDVALAKAIDAYRD